jgi:hypothetical protein
LGTQLGKVEKQVGQVTLGINYEGRNAVDRRFFEQRYA